MAQRGLDTDNGGLGLDGKSVHGFGHNEGVKDFTGLQCRAIIRRHHFEIIARPAGKLKAVPGGDGNMLSNTMIIYASPAANKHHTKCENWPMIIAGGCGQKGPH